MRVTVLEPLSGRTARDPHIRCGPRGGHGDLHETEHPMLPSSAVNADVARARPNEECTEDAAREHRPRGRIPLTSRGLEPSAPTPPRSATQAHRRPSRGELPTVGRERRRRMSVVVRPPVGAGAGLYLRLRDVAETPTHSQMRERAFRAVPDLRRDGAATSSSLAGSKHPANPRAPPRADYHPEPGPAP